MSSQRASLVNVYRYCDSQTALLNSAILSTLSCQVGTVKKATKEGESHGLEGSSTREPDTHQQQQSTSYKDIQHLTFGFKHIVQIDHLDGLINLKKLQLDNNCLRKIENLEHLVR